MTLFDTHKTKNIYFLVFSFSFFSSLALFCLKSWHFSNKSINIWLNCNIILHRVWKILFVWFFNYKNKTPLEIVLLLAGRAKPRGRPKQDVRNLKWKERRVYEHEQKWKWSQIEHKTAKIMMISSPSLQRDVKCQKHPNIQTLRSLSSNLIFT
jgi:hypothetical protein